MHLIPKIPVVAYESSFPKDETYSGLLRLAYNFYWSWHKDAQELFSTLNPKLWAEGVGPVEILQNSPNFKEVVQDSAYQQKYSKVMKKFDEYLAEKNTWYVNNNRPELQANPIAYFCAEYGLHESFPIYSGGLGILAGDHCKEVSDLDIPFVAVGLFYRRGFFKQMIDAEGKQEHYSPKFEPKNMPILQVLSPKTKAPLLIEVEFPGRKVFVTAWLATVGRMPILLLDTDIPQNAPEDRPMTNQLYVSGRDMRLHQELILGIGGVRVLRELGISPSVFHMNEGHSAFLLIERLKEYSLAGKTMPEALALVKANSVFTIHTPVPAGNERFWAANVAQILNPVLTDGKLAAAEILKLALGADKDPNWFDMTAMGLKLSRARNGVSLLHGITADNTWKKLINADIIGLTNGVHMPTWLGSQMAQVFAQAGANFDSMTNLNVKPTGQNERLRFDDVKNIDKKVLWTAHNAQKNALFTFVREKLKEQFLRHGKGPSELKEALTALRPDAFVIGFARRFASYKRASLMFSDEKRLLKILDNPKRPVQIIFAGKAHPADKDGQKIIAKVFQQTQSPRFKGKVFFVEDYNMEVGRYLVQGVDLWLNNPRRPLEASGTSGMKAAANGVPNMSVLDGWWDEAWDARQNCKNGFAIGTRVLASTDIIQDKNDAVDFYRVLEQEVLPAYFNQNAEGISDEWIDIMKNSIASTIYDFSTMRMLNDYYKKMY